MNTVTRGAGRRHRGRELALRVLFELEGTEKDYRAALDYQAADLGATPDVAHFAEHLVNGCLQHGDALDNLLDDASANWRLEDLGKVERAVLRLGAYELLHERGTPVAVVIDESVELAKAYAGETAAQFVNGVLGHIARAGV
jgi:transcription antitermination protein NusB